MEKWDLYDINRIKTGKTVIRGSKLEQGDYHLVVHVCVINSKSQMLIQQRQPFKEGFSNLWDITVGGSALQGETSQKAAERELLEEVGIGHDFSKERAFFTVNFKYGFDDYYIIFKDVDADELKLQYEEVQAVKWATKPEIKAMIENKTFVPYYHSVIDLIFDIVNHRGSHQYGRSFLTL